MIDGYRVDVELIEEPDDEPYYMAWLPAFGKAGCSATADTEESSIELLRNVYKDVKDYYEEIRRKLPMRHERKIKCLKKHQE